MKEVEVLAVDAVPVDEELQDDGTVGPELAHLARSYRHSPRALVFRNPSSDWRLFVVLLPLATRLSLMTNPIFAQLTRAWGLNARFVGVDRDGLVHDFRALLSDRTLKLLVDLLARHVDLRARHDAAQDALDLLFASLADEMLTTLDRRRADWSRHLDREHRLEPGVAATLFDRSGRYPDFLAKLRAALRDEIVDVALYGRALRSIDLREGAVDARVAAIVEASLDPVTMAKLARTGAGLHLGGYNWLRIDARHAAPRAHVLARLPSFATFFAEALLSLDAWRPGEGADHEADGHEPDCAGDDARRTGRAAGSTYDLRRLAARPDSAHSLRWAVALKQAIDAGQDRAVIEALAQRFAVGDNVVRRLWRERPAALGQPPTWQLAQILRRLDEAGEREWPTDARGWEALIATAVPAEAR